MAATRLERLAPEARRVLRAASVFGQVFWKTGVGALLGQRVQGPASSRHGAAAASPDTGAWLDALVAQEVITRHRKPSAPGSTSSVPPRPDGELAGEEQFAFRHSLVREAAYSMLTDGDRELGHKLAAEWLEKIGHRDAMVLAEHFERGGEPGRAIGWYRRAAAQALEGNDFGAALARVRHALGLGAEDDDRGALLLSEAEAHRWRGELAEAEQAATAAMAILPRGRDEWYRAASELAIAAATHGRHDVLAALAVELVLDEPADEARGRYAIVSAGIAVRLYYSDRRELADTLFARLEQAAASSADDPAVAGEIHQARGYRAHVEGDLSALLRSARLARAHFEQAGELRNAVQQQVNAGYACLEMGDHDGAEVALRSALLDAEKLGLPAVAALAKHNLGLALARQGALDEARAVEREAVVSSAAQGHVRMECGARLYLALILAETGALDLAEREARAALETAAAAPLLRPKAFAALAHVQLSRGDSALALASAKEAQRTLDDLGSIEEGEALVRLVHAEALRATGDIEASVEAILAARKSLETRAAKIGDAEHRTSFLTRIPENARTIELAIAWAGAR
jgi:tetratricopeptide (TPR) repeat protein